MRKRTLHQHMQISNDLLYYIYKYIDSDINIDELAKMHNLSREHLHRVFKEQIGVNLYEMIQSIRIKKASNLLITNPHSSITEIAKMCGYSSHSSFIRVFKSYFGQTPKEWRSGGYKRYSSKIIGADLSDESNEIYEDFKPKIIKEKSIKLYYLRHRGYDETIRETWQKLQTWIYTNDIKNYRFIGIYHDNPIITSLKNCYYVAGVEVLDGSILNSATLPSFVIPSGIYATFEIRGVYGDILRFIQWVYHEWLVGSGYETTTLPSFTIFKKNHFLEEDERFDGTYYLPIRFS